MFKRIISIFALTVFSLSFTSAHAALMEYSYQGTSFTHFGSGTNPSPVTFDNTHSVSGSFIADELTASTTGGFDADDIQSFVFRAGDLTISSGDVGAQVEAVRFSVDVYGNIEQWGMMVSFFDADWATPDGIGSSRYVISTDYTHDEAFYMECSNLKRDGTGCNTNSDTTASGYVDATPGLWTISTVPEPSIIALFALGLVGIGFARRRQS